MSDVDAACAVAHGDAVTEGDNRTLVAVFASPVAHHLLHYGAHAGYRTILIEPDDERSGVEDLGEVSVQRSVPEWLDDTADVVVTDHHRDELGPMLRDVLALSARWVGVMGNPRHAGPHVEALSKLGVSPADIDRVHRPVGLNIGSRTPAEIAIATLAGLIADRNQRPGGFEFAVRS